MPGVVYCGRSTRLQALQAATAFRDVSEKHFLLTLKIN